MPRANPRDPCDEGPCLECFSTIVLVLVTLVMDGSPSHILRPGRVLDRSSLLANPSTGDLTPCDAEEGTHPAPHNQWQEAVMAALDQARNDQSVANLKQAGEKAMMRSENDGSPIDTGIRLPKT